MAVTIDGSANTITAQATIALGNNQTYQDVTASRAFATTYTNSSGSPIFVSAYSTTGTSAGTITFTVDGNVLGRQGISAGASCTMRLNVTFVVPAGSTYSVEIGNGTNTLTTWFELR